MVSVVSCVKQNNQRILSLLLDVPGSVPKNELKEALLLSSEKGYIECTNSLIKAGADIDCQNSSGETPLILATKENKPDIIKALIEAKCDCYMTAKSGNAAIHIAAQKDLLQCFQILLDNGVDINTRDPGQNTPLIISIIKKKYLILEEVLSRPDCDVNATDCYGWTALHHAAHKATGVKQLLKAGANPNVYNDSGNTPLMLAAIEGFSKVIHLLTKANCDVNMKDSSSAQKTAMHIIALKGHSECIEDMLEAGLDLNILDNEYRTPLWYALHSGRFEAVESLLKYTSHVASFNCPAHAPETSCPVKLAFLKGAKKVIKQFILIGFDKDHIRYYIQNSDDVTADWTTVDQNDWFSFIQQPLTLLQISRIWIRHYLGRLFYLNVSKLPLPKSFQDFLLFSDFKNI
ncbi:ankyrin repeat and SOCS box protein 3 isoform X1 [Octopus sinensis]|uniref:Ankyrin repeat and SOCS box protein 3 isoform X1 n=1 Tax=Octopus sinensis TaxID=2607531 RepID=A0A6P7TBD3_9MOLL|nr:ankyrin repeat and SOCS box protein 3 isoform X1 [Octopus sinensis]